MNKEKLEVLIKLPKQQFDAVIKVINPKITDSDLEPMFPEGWDHESKWFMPQYNYDSFRSTQIDIDDWNQKLAGC